jgi:hypothetical protein
MGFLMSLSEAWVYHVERYDVSTVAALDLMDWEKSRRKSVKVIGFQEKIRTGHVQNTLEDLPLERTFSVVLHPL